MNKECLVSALHKDALILSLSLVHTARRLIRLVALASSSDYLEYESASAFFLFWEGSCASLRN